MHIDQSILIHLFGNKKFLKSLQSDFEKEEILEISKYSQDVNNEYPEVMDQFYEWLKEEFINSETKILWIAWDSDGWGPGGSGFCRFNSRFGLVKMDSSDYEDDNDHIEIFNKKTFFPWGIENLMNDYIDMDSDVYNEKELLSLAEKMGMHEHTILTINDKKIKRG